MARPAKNSCDYFPHDTGMRNHKKVKAIRNKFGITGYGIWVMILELLTGSDGNVFEDCPLEIELLSGDFGVSCEEIRDVLDYCYTLELLFINDGFVNSDSLDDRLAPVYEKREKAKDMSAKQRRKLGKFVSNNDTIGITVTETTDSSVKPVTEKPQSKVNKTKVNNINIPFEDFWNLYDKKDDKKSTEPKWNKLTDEERLKAMQHIPKYKLEQPDKKFRKNPETYLNKKSFNNEVLVTHTSQLSMQLPQEGVTKEYWEIHWGNLYKTKEEFMKAESEGLIEY